MIPSNALVDALDSPAAVADGQGRILASNAAFAASGADLDVLLAIAPGEWVETLSSPGGALIAWRLAELPGGHGPRTRSFGPRQGLASPLVRPPVFRATARI